MTPSTTNDPTPCTVVSLEAKADKVLPAARPPTKRKAILIPLLLLAFFGAATISMLITIVVQNEATRATDVRGDALRSRETGHVLQTRSINMFSTMADLPCQSTSFISNLDHVCFCPRRLGWRGLTAPPQIIPNQRPHSPTHNPT